MVMKSIFQKHVIHLYVVILQHCVRIWLLFMILLDGLIDIIISWAKGQQPFRPFLLLFASLPLAFSAVLPPRFCQIIAPSNRQSCRMILVLVSMPCLSSACVLRRGSFLTLLTGVCRHKCGKTESHYALHFYACFL